MIIMIIDVFEIQGFSNLAAYFNY